MRTTIAITITSLVLFACTAPTTDSQETAESSTEQIAMNYYGDTITANGAMTVDAFKKRVAGKDSLRAKVEVTINETCKVKGCWMLVDLGDGEEMRVKFKDYGFFVPKEGASGKVAIMEGYAYTDTVSVADLQHLAEDAGKTPEEIAAISVPEIGVNFEATGVIIKE